MKSYPLTGPPSASGIYIIKNETTKQVYVGQSVDLRRRHTEWRAVFASGLGASNHALHGAITSSNAQDWEFVVFELCEKSQLNSKENEVIDLLKKNPKFQCLNGTEAKIPRQVTANTGSVPLTEVRDHHGAVMTYAEIAARCGTTPQAVKKRLAAWRRKGKNKIHIADLL